MATATIVSAAATAVYAVIAAISLFMLSRQIRDARRFGAAPPSRALAPEVDDARSRETIVRYLEFFERVEHLRGAGVLPADVLRRAFGPVLAAHLRGPRFERTIEQDKRRHDEVLALARHLSG